ncbi:UNKNOWN [Stylonychia lemnae]|uniref:CRC domain-containing protein n=1 Tax=Stylonychia lemnae TaxID=5949 RepID=A0A078AKS3_STYLE|nr:UNKNOWN [Stylonychia lemnae]|eukprot:CDW82491.1 UNKNOWN [Stylonychia lemnae]
MNIKMSDNSRFQELSLSQGSSQNQMEFDSDNQNLKKVLDILDNQPAQQIQIRNQSIERKMAAFKVIQSEGLCNEIESHQQSYPFSRNQGFSRQNLQRNENTDFDNVAHSKFYTQDHHQSFDIHDKESAFDKSQSFCQQISQASGKLQIGQNSINSGAMQPQYMYNSHLASLRSLHDHSTLPSKDALNEEMAPNFISNKHYKDSLTPRLQHQHQSYPNSLQFIHPQVLQNEQATRVMINANFGREVEYITPIKIQTSTLQYGKNQALTEVKQMNSAKKSTIQNLENIRKQFLPVHVITDKSSKAKILDYQNGKPKKSSCSGKQGTTKSNINQQLSSSHHLQNFSSDIQGIESNRRMNKIKNKKRNANKTEPSIIEQSQFMTESLSSVRSTLTVQTYQIQHLNSLEELNKNLKEQKRQYISLLGKQEQNQYESIQIDADPCQKYHESKIIINQEEQKTSKINKKGLQIQNYQITNLSRNKSQWFNENPAQKIVTFQEHQSEGTLTKSKTQVFQQPFFSVQEKSATFSQQQIQTEKRVKCNCQKNHCAQAYCDCLKSGSACDPKVCQCQECENTEHNNQLRNEIIVKQQKQGGQREGCNCKNSQCLKKYCECFQQGNGCDPKKCRCQDCKNIDNKLVKTNKTTGVSRHTQ